jgi:hypothetical protein
VMHRMCPARHRQEGSSRMRENRKVADTCPDNGHNLRELCRGKLGKTPTSEIVVDEKLSIRTVEFFR